MFENKISELQKNGFIHLKNYFKEDELKHLCNDSANIIKKAKKGSWKHIRIYRDYFSLDGLNIFGVDYPFNHEISNTIYNNFNKLNYKDDLLKILGWNDFKTTVLRLHSNSKFYKYQGTWHRDDQNYPSPNSVQAILYLKDEAGFKIVPKIKNDELEDYFINTKNDNISKNALFAKLNKDMFVEVNAKKGDIFVFESGLLHQGFCKSERLHYHLRHERSEIINKDKSNLYNFIKPLLPNYNLDIIKINHSYLEKSFFKSVLKIKNSFFYFFPRVKIIISNLFKKVKQDPFFSTFWQ